MPHPRTPHTPFDATAAYLIGIGGCGMSGLARMLRSRGVDVAGSDTAETAVTDALQSQGIHVSLDQDSAHIPEHAALVVASAAIPPSHPEILAATARGLPVLSYAETLGRCMHDRTGVAVAGTHGKSTTIAMLGYALIRAGLDPTVIVGATVPQLSDQHPPAPTGFRLGADTVPRGPLKDTPGLLVAEACEFNRSFHQLKPRVAAITSVEADHLDVYGSVDAVVKAFNEFAKLLPPRANPPATSLAQGGVLLIAHDGAHRREVTAGVNAHVETIGFAPHADWHVTFDTQQRRVGLNHHGNHVANWIIRQPGVHMAANSATAAALAIILGAPPHEAANALADFTGADRRLQLLGSHAPTPDTPEHQRVRVYDDYGHHPTEIDVTLRALRDAERPHEQQGRLVCVFQPHQHSRTRFLLDEFANAFNSADVVIVPHIYFVRDSEIEKTRVHASDLVDRLRARGVHAMHLYPFDAIVEHLQAMLKPNDLLVVMGAGPVGQVAHDLLKNNQRQSADHQHAQS